MFHNVKSYAATTSEVSKKDLLVASSCQFIFKELQPQSSLAQSYAGLCLEPSLRLRLLQDSRRSKLLLSLLRLLRRIPQSQKTPPKEGKNVATRLRESQLPREKYQRRSRQIC